MKLFNWEIEFTNKYWGLKINLISIEIEILSFWQFIFIKAIFNKFAPFYPKIIYKFTFLKNHLKKEPEKKGTGINILQRLE